MSGMSDAAGMSPEEALAIVDAATWDIITDLARSEDDDRVETAAGLLQHLIDLGASPGQALLAVTGHAAQLLKYLAQTRAHSVEDEAQAYTDFHDFAEIARRALVDDGD